MGKNAKRGCTGFSQQVKVPFPLPIQVILIRHEAMGLLIVNSDITASAIHSHKTELIRLMTVKNEQHRSGWKCTSLFSPTYTSHRIKSKVKVNASLRKEIFLPEPHHLQPKLSQGLSTEQFFHPNSAV